MRWCQPINPHWAHERCWRPSPTKGTHDVEAPCSPDPDRAAAQLHAGSGRSTASGPAQAYATCGAYYHTLLESFSWRIGQETEHLHHRATAAYTALLALLGDSDTALKRLVADRQRLAFHVDGSLRSLRRLEAQYDEACTALFLPLYNDTGRAAEPAASSPPRTRRLRRLRHQPARTRRPRATGARRLSLQGRRGVIGERNWAFRAWRSSTPRARRISRSWLSGTETTGAPRWWSRP